jgi:molecular chaperone DnaJ
MAKDYYRTLGVGRDAPTEEIKKAFRSIARATHPDANAGDPALEARFREAAEAYEILSDPDRRRRYDRGDVLDLTDLLSGFGGFDDLLRSVFGESSMFGGGSGGSRRQVRGRDILVAVEIDLKQAAFGTESDVEFRSQVLCPQCEGTGAQDESGTSTCPDCGGAGSVRMARRSLFGTMMTVGTCPTCQGAGILIKKRCRRCSGAGSVEDDTSVTIEIPPGVATGTRLRLSGRGESAGRSGPPGDLFLEVRVKPHPQFERREDDLVHKTSIGIGEAALGTRLAIPLLEGGETDVDIPAGTQPGAVFRLGGKGVTRLGRRSRGDLHVVIEVSVPRELGADEEDLLRRWAELRGERVNRRASMG